MPRAGADCARSTSDRMRASASGPSYRTRTGPSSIGGGASISWWAARSIATPRAVILALRSVIGEGFVEQEDELRHDSVGHVGSAELFAECGKIHAAREHEPVGRQAHAAFTQARGEGWLVARPVATMIALEDAVVA